MLSSGTLQSLGDPTKVLLIIQFKPDKGIALKHKPGSKKHKSRAYPQNYGWGFGKESVGDFNELLVLIGCNKLEMFAVFFHSFAISLQISPQNKNGQSKAKQSKAKQCEAKQSREKQNKAKQLNAKQCKAMQSKPAEPDQANRILTPYPWQCSTHSPCGLRRRMSECPRLPVRANSQGTGWPSQGWEGGECALALPVAVLHTLTL